MLLVMLPPSCEGDRDQATVTSAARVTRVGMRKPAPAREGVARTVSVGRRPPGPEDQSKSFLRVRWDLSRPRTDTCWQDRPQRTRS